MKYYAYDYIIVAFSGGRFGGACVYHLINEDIPKEKIKIWYHKIIGCATRFNVSPEGCGGFAKNVNVSTLEYDTLDTLHNKRVVVIAVDAVTDDPLESTFTLGMASYKLLSLWEGIGVPTLFKS